ncbi:hypothetical protein GCM10028786_17310 [Flaviaesturariibacter terrae]
MLLLLLLAFSLTAAFTFTRHRSAPNPGEQESALTAYKKRFAIGCGPGAAGIDFSDSANVIPLLDGWGSYRMPVTAMNDSARIYFEQGINMYYGFHIIEALASFERSISFDSSFAMGYWGKALAYGPNINDFGYSASPDALTAVRRARALSAGLTPVEAALIGAMEQRYSQDTTQSREQLNQQYADAMKAVQRRFPASADAAALYADALMLQHPWDLYTHSFAPKPWTAEIVATLERVLQRVPDHPGAVHYYVHAVEASARPERALAGARKLPLLMPGVAHVVHMPSHIYIRAGYYNEGVAVNEQAVKSYAAYASLFPPVQNNAPLYLVHNLHMQATCANMGGRYREALAASLDCRRAFDSSWQDLPDFMGIYAQYLYMTPYLTLLRFGKWADVLRTQEPPAAHLYANLLWHYGRGLAFARKHDFVRARQELAALEATLQAPQMRAPAPSFSNAGVVGGTVARQILQGILAEEQGAYDQSIALLREAVAREDSMQYNEPKDWVHPARHYLGAVLLKAGKPAEAETVYREDLRINPANGWALAGLTSACSRQGKQKAAAEARTRWAKAFAKADERISVSAF